MSAATRPGTEHRRGRWSLQRRLSLPIVGLVGAVIGVLGAEAYREVHDAAVESAVDHLARAGRELATTSASTSAQRLVRLRAVASDPVVARAVTAPVVAPADSAPLLAR